MIPDEAVEAAMHAIARNYGNAGTPANTVLWERVAIDARAALEAAAPHLMSAALNDAAAIFQGRLADGTGNGRAYNSYQVADMLRARAAALKVSDAR